MNVLYISYDGMTDPLGQSQVIPYLKGLANLGHQITIVSCEKKERFSNQNINIKEILQKAKISWLPVPYSSSRLSLSKISNLYRIKKACFALCKTNSYEMVHCRSYMSALIGIKLKRKFKLKFIFDMRGFWADERIDGKIWDINNKLHKIFYSYFKKKEIEFLTQADYTISLTQNAKQEILSWQQFQNNKILIQVIPCCVDENLFTKKNIGMTEQNLVMKKLNISKEDIVITYLGSIGTWYMLEEMLDFFKLMLIKIPFAKFLFISQEDKNKINSISAKKKIPAEAIIIQSASRIEVPLYLSLAQLSLYFIKPTFSKIASSPTKTGEIMSMGIPIITNSGIGDCDEIIIESEAGLIINSFCEAEYLRIINQIDVLLKIDKLKLIASSHNYFSLDKGIDLYDEVYRKI